MVTADDLRLAGMDVPVDGDRAFLSRGDRVNGKLRAGDNIAAGEYIGLARLEARQRHGDGTLCAGASTEMPFSSISCPTAEMTAETFIVS